jgi:hypothetical protein
MSLHFPGAVATALLDAGHAGNVDSDPLEFRTSQQCIEEYEAALGVIRVGRPSDISAARLNRFLYGVSHSYVTFFGFASIYEHVRLEKELRRRRAVDVRLEQHDGGLRLIVGRVGRRPQVSAVCGVLAHFGVTLQRGRFISAGGQLALDVFELSDEEDVLGSVVSAPMELRRLMTARLAGS